MFQLFDQLFKYALFLFSNLSFISIVIENSMQTIINHRTILQLIDYHLSQIDYIIVVVNKDQFHKSIYIVLIIKVRCIAGNCLF